MYKKLIHAALLIVAIMASVTGCGSGSDLGGGVSEFKTVIATAVPSTPRLEADLITGNACTDAGSTGGTVESESIEFTISSRAVSSPALPVSVTGYTVSYVPKNAVTPPLNSITSNFGPIVVNPGSSATITVPVITFTQKIDIIAADTSFPCSLTSHQYDVTVSFNAAELGADDSGKSINGRTVMSIADMNNN